MEDYKEMYYTLFNKITDIISELKAIQAKAEDMFIMQEAEQRSVRSLEGRNVKGVCDGLPAHAD